ncbi:MAG: DsbA family protein [Alphaproteobacteria bacterium]|nr:DsbA family protein [Alphaproteobacteria bacterium]
MMRNLLGALVLTAALISGAAHAAEAPAADFTDKQKEQIEAIVKNLLTNKDPEIVLNAAKEFQKKQDAENSKKATEALGKNKDKLFNNAADPFFGNEKGDVVLVEFFDYNCGYCKKAAEPIRKLIENDKKVKVVMKEYPILAESSRVAARAAFAAIKQKKYTELHNALMENKGALSEDSIMEMAVKVGIDKEKLKKDMESPETAAYLQSTSELGREIGAHGTPTFIVGEKIVPGAMEYEEMKKLVDDARASATKKVN